MGLESDLSIASLFNIGAELSVVFVFDTLGVRVSRMPIVPEELDVFRLPHSHMKKLLSEVREHVRCMIILASPHVENALLYTRGFT